jgi:drug/metabolite transporter (DMT)-like permease
MTQRQKAYLALAVICIVWGATWVVSRHAIIVGHFEPLQMSAYRYLIAGGLFCGYYFTKGFGFPKAKEFPKLLLLSVLVFVLSNGLSTMGVKAIGSGLGAVIGTITSLWLAVFGYLILKQKVLPKTIIGLIVGFLGIIIIFYNRLDSFNNNGFLMGVVLSIIASITWALGTIYTVKYSLSGNAYYNIGWQMLFGGIILYILSYTQPRAELHQITTWGWIDFGILTFAGAILTFICYMYLLKRLPAAQVSVYVYINPIIAMLLSHQVFNEAVTATLGIGAAITLFGVYLVNSSFKAKVKKIIK